MQKKLLAWIVGLGLLWSFPSCGIYSLDGASIPEGMETVQIDLFENNAPIVVPYLSTEFTEALKNRIRSQTPLSSVRADGDAIFQGNITGYSITPTAVEGNNRAGLSRLTITVQVKFTNNIDPEGGFEKSFSRYQDFAGSAPSQEAQIISEINKMLTEDIFNAAFANW